MTTDAAARPVRVSSEEQQREVLEALAEIWVDFRSWCSLVEIRTKHEGKVPFSFDRWNQEQIKFDNERTGSDVVLKPRQIGFSTIELARDLFFAVTREGVNVQVVAHKKSNAIDLFLGLRYMADALRRRGLLPKTKADNVRELVFWEIGSAVRVVEAGATTASAQDKGRSGTIHRLHATEVAFWKQPAETMKALTSCVPEGGEVVIESTANGAGGLFYNLIQAAAKRQGPYRLHFFPWYDHAEYRIDPGPDFDPEPRDKWEVTLRAKGCDDAQIAWWRSKVDNPAVGIEGALQEYPVDPGSCFRTSGSEYISAAHVDALSESTREPIRELPVVWRGLDGKARGRELGTLEIYAEPEPGEDYVIGGDVAEGVGGDASSADVMNARSGEVVAKCWSKTIAPGDFGLALAVIGYLYNTATVGPERNNHGAATLRALEVEARYPKIYKHTDKKLGWPTNGQTRPILFDDLRRSIREGVATHPDAATVAEARTLIVNAAGRPEARSKGQEGGCHDDRFVSWAIAWQIRSRPGFVPASFHVSGL
ncbi:MAG: hypothetical protein RID81_07030 [Sandaracinaceae bacterium]